MTSPPTRPGANHYAETMGDAATAFVDELTRRGYRVAWPDEVIVASEWLLTLQRLADRCAAVRTDGELATLALSIGNHLANLKVRT